MPRTQHTAPRAHTARGIARTAAPILPLAALAATGCASADQADHARRSTAERVHLVGAAAARPAGSEIALGSGDRLGRTLFERHRSTGIPTTASFAAVQPD